MSTQSQITANRENSQHSTGPITPEGKAAVSQNRATHGLCYNAATFAVLPCEDQSDYDNLVAMLQMVHEPKDFAEGLLVASLAQHRWLLDRATRLQETTFDPQTGQIADQKLFTLYLRYATTHERAFHKCVNELAKLRAEKTKAGIGSESQKRLASPPPDGHRHSRNADSPRRSQNPTARKAKKSEPKYSSTNKWRRKRPRKPLQISTLGESWRPCYA